MKLNIPYQKPPEFCPVCKEKTDFKFIQDHKNERGEWSLYECPECQVQFWIPFKAPGLEHYERAYIVRDTMNPKLLYDYHKHFLKIHKNFPKSTKVLDLGCGTGDLLAELKKRGCKVWGVDIDKNAINFVKKYFKLENAYPMSAEEFFRLPNLPKFDLIMFFEFLEHLDNPLDFIENVKKLLKEDGVIILSTPSRERIFANLFGCDFPPHHLTRWNEKAISNLFKKIDFEIIRISYVDQLKFLLESLNDKIRLGLVFKTAKISKSSKINDREKGIIGGTFLTRIIHFGAYLKDYLITGIPAIFLLLISKLMGYKNGDMLIWLKKS
jgi:SAM-dependent methyltransferase